MCRKCSCSIVPEDILIKLAEEGNEGSKAALRDLNSLRVTRNNILATLTKPQSVVASGNGNRYVYDSKNTQQLRNILVREENDPPTGDTAVDDIYTISGFVRNYFRTNFKYNSLDNNGMDILLNVHYKQNYNNAFWDGTEMAFGDGDGNTFQNFASSIDVVAHELMHGITQHIANLNYYSQSGALNEHFSDVFGTVCKQKMKNQTVNQADWLIGNSVVGTNFPGNAIRSMSAPGTAYNGDIQPDHMNNYYNGPNDNQGVHINSGIPNKVFYLSSIGIGSIDSTSLIWFRCLQNMNPQSRFNDFKTELLVATTNLEQNGQIPANSVNVINNSLNQVGL